MSVYPCFASFMDLLAILSGFVKSFLLNLLAKIIKSYGVWMRANLIKSNHYSIGAKWQRPNGAFPLEMDGSGLVNLNSDESMIELNEKAIKGNSGGFPSIIGVMNQEIGVNG
uniref:Uncharacterized protein n=1 Tax=Cannabis sativa TaxID=3483 RepID=A0A803NI21_CANSA